ncbi:MAG: response regulator transcription factor [Opitutales bacterium]
MAELLLIEDHETLRLVMRAVLESRGHHCTEAASGREALLELRRKSFDAMVLDLMLPEVRGIEVIRLAQQQHPEMPILVTTGRQEIYGAEALRAGASMVLYKPFLPREFLETLQQTLNGFRETAPDEMARFSA